MRAREFLKEYSREKTAAAFGDKLISALQNDKSPVLGGALGTARAYIQQKIKTNSPIEDSNKTVIINDILAAIETADPTKNKEYVQWLAKIYANTGVKMEDLMSRGLAALRVYQTLKIKRLLPPEFRDIGRLNFKGLEDVAANQELLQQLQDKEEQGANVDKGTAQTVFENDKVRIVVPQNTAAACYYGQGTRWCTAATGSNNYFDRYARDGDLYILLPKQPKYNGEKYQLHFSSGQFMDEQDNSVDNIIELLDMRFGNLVDFFREREPAINDWLVFSSDEVLAPLIGKIRQAVNDHVNEMASNWEVEDDYWWDYLRKEGYVYPEGHEEEGQIDWDKVHDADVYYTDWNYEVADFMGNINNSVDLTPREVRELAEEVSREWGADTQDITDLDKIFAYSIEKNIRGRDGDGGVPEWIHEHIYIKKRDGRWDVSLLYVQKDGQRKEYEIH